MIGSHNIPPPPSNDGSPIAAVSGDPKGTYGTGIEGTCVPVVGGVAIDIKDTIGIIPVVESGGNPDIILEYETGSTPGGTGSPLAAAAATISAGVGSKVPVITL